MRNYDEAIDFYIKKLGFEIRQDNRISEARRWGRFGTARGWPRLHLACEGRDSATGRPYWKSDWWARFSIPGYRRLQPDYADYISKGVTFLESPREETYGIVAVFEDLYGNRWDLIQHKGNSGMKPQVEPLKP